MVERSATAMGPRIPGVEGLHAIGRGGFATVYEGWQPDFHRRVAVKVLDVVPDDDAVSRFRREVRAMGAISDHPHTVPVYESGVTEGRPYLVMPLLTASLADDLKTGPLPPGEVARLGAEIADALSAAHRLGLLHRDVKPGNILRNAYGHRQLGDFGIARFSDATTTREGLAATIAYAPPEVLAGQPAGTAADVYSLGATLHAALRGAPPFEPRDGEPPLAFAARIITDPLPDLASGGAPPGLAAVIERATAKDPKDRFPTAATLHDALLAADLTPIVPAPVDAPDRTVWFPGPPADTVALPDAPAPTELPGPRPTSRRWRYAVTIAVLAVAIATSVVALAHGAAKRATSQAPTQPTTSVTPPGRASPARSAPTQPSPSTSSPGATSVVATVRDYYALVNEHRLTEAFTWLAPGYQQRTGFASYKGFWSTIARVDVLDVAATGHEARVTLRYTRTDGTLSTEHAIEDFVVDPSSSHLLIAGYRLA